MHSIHHTFTFMHLAEASTYSVFRLYMFYQYMCSLGIEPMTFCAADAMLYHWATGTQKWQYRHLWCYERFLFQINAVFFYFVFIKDSWKIKCITVSTKILCGTTVFNIDNNQKCFLSSKSAYYNDFWRSCDTEDWSNDAENTEINYILTYSHKKQIF